MRFKQYHYPIAVLDSALKIRFIFSLQHKSNKVDSRNYIISYIYYYTNRFLPLQNELPGSLPTAFSLFGAGIHAQEYKFRNLNFNNFKIK